MGSREYINIPKKGKMQKMADEPTAKEVANIGTIRTGVDRLVELIERRKRISLKDAATELAVPRIVIEEWVNFLEEKEIIKIEYKLTTPYLVKKDVTTKDVEKKTKEFHGRKEEK